VFEVYFSLRGSHYRILDEDDELLPDDEAAMGEMPGQAGAGGPGEALSNEELAEMLYRALLEGDEALLRALARQAVTRFAGMEPGRPVGGTYYLYRTLRNLDLDSVLERLMEQTRQDSLEPLTPLEERLEEDEFEHRIDQLRKEV